MLPFEERERRLRVFEQGVQSDFWKVFKEQLQILSDAAQADSIRFTRQNNQHEALVAAIEKETYDRIIREPSIVIQKNTPLFRKFIFDACKTCGHIMQKLRPKEQETSQAR
jgi:hypothetical protein